MAYAWDKFPNCPFPCSQEFDKDNISDATIKKLKKYVDDPQYTPETVGRQSRAAMSLCMWTRAMDVYNRVAKVREALGLLGLGHVTKSTPTAMRN